MKKIFSLLLVIFSCYFLLAQQIVDSLQKLLAGAIDDTTRINFLNRLSSTYKNSKLDSAFSYANNALELSRKVHYEIGEITALCHLADIFSSTGNYSNALEHALEGFKKSEETGDKNLMARCLNTLGGVYASQGDLKQAMQYGLKAKSIIEEIHDERFLSIMLINTGYGYGQMNELDSARIYLNQGLNLALKLQDQRWIATAYLNLGMIHSKAKQFEIAFGYYKLCIPNFKTINNLRFLTSTYLRLAEAFDSTGRQDSAFYYGMLSHSLAKEMNNMNEFFNSAKHLASLFKKSGQFDSAFIYEEIAMNANDSLTNQEKQKQVQLLTFNEQLRQMEIAEQKRKDEEVRKRNLELAGIAIFIPVFLFIVLLLGRKKVKSRTVEFLGVLALLFLFEFIVLFAHPYIGHWTNESPVWMLLILVGVAAILIPLHHKSEVWIKKKLASKSEVRLQPETL